MKLQYIDEVRHDILLIAAIALAILFATGLAGPPGVSEQPIVIP
ncbi:MAG: hypothetical protein XD78_1685 [Desulfotomaculum sp. 46_296]|nr:MAG: hypothetical protein XD78_1685 [Desulfotomaculum sp. 46_296]